MWNEIKQYEALFANIVITGLDNEGYPLSLRLRHRLHIDEVQQIFSIVIPPSIAIQPGPASLLYHSHDEVLSNLQSFVLHGLLDRLDAGWVFRPLRFIPGVGLGNNLSFINQAASTATAYLEKRKLTRPEVPWETIQATKKRARES